MQTPDSILGAEPAPTHTRLVLTGIVIGFLLYHLLVPKPTRVVRFALVPPDLEAH